MLKSLRWNPLACVIALSIAFVAQSGTAEDVAPVPQKTPVQQTAAVDPSGEPSSTTASEPAVASEETSPRPTVEAFHVALLEIMKSADTLGFQGRIDRLAPLMKETFDLDFMASKTVGSHWRKLSDADKERWARVFARMTTANYAGRFTGFTGESFVTTGVEEAARGTRMVLTKIVLPEDEDVQINYRLRMKNGEWKVIDVYLNGTVSELALRRSEYSSALKREGLDELIASIETKIEDLKAKGLVDG